MSKNDQKMVKKWSKNGQKMVKKWSKNGQKMVKKWSKNGQKMVKKWSKRLKLAKEKEKKVDDVTLAPVNLIAMRRSA